MLIHSHGAEPSVSCADPSDRWFASDQPHRPDATSAQISKPTPEWHELRPPVRRTAPARSEGGANRPREAESAGVGVGRRSGGLSERTAPQRRRHRHRGARGRRNQLYQCPHWRMRFIPMRRPGEVDEVAYTILFLASDESSYITGSEIHVDGGVLAVDDQMGRSAARQGQYPRQLGSSRHHAANADIRSNRRSRHPGFPRALTARPCWGWSTR